MSEIIYISPQLYFISPNSEKNWKSETPRAGFIPLLKSDISKFQAQTKLISSPSNNVTQSSSLVSPLKESNSTSKVTSSATSSATSTLYQPLKQFLPISLEQQLKTVCLQGLPSHLSIESIDAFIKSIFSYISLNLQVESWTAMNLSLIHI